MGKSWKRWKQRNRGPARNPAPWYRYGKRGGKPPEPVIETAPVEPDLFAAETPVVEVASTERSEATTDTGTAKKSSTKTHKPTKKTKTTRSPRTGGTK